jgi:hypothetical protein
LLSYSLRAPERLNGIFNNEDAFNSKGIDIIFINIIEDLIILESLLTLAF